MFSTDHVSNGAYLDNVRLTEIKINEKHLLLWFYRVCGFSIYRDWTVHKPIFKWIVSVSQSTGIIHFDALLVKHWKLIEHVKLKRYYFQIQKAFPNLRFPWTVIIFFFLRFWYRPKAVRQVFVLKVSKIYFSSPRISNTYCWIYLQSKWQPIWILNTYYVETIKLHFTLIHF